MNTAIEQMLKGYDPENVFEQKLDRYSDSDLRIFFKGKQEQSEKVAAWRALKGVA